MTGNGGIQTAGAHFDQLFEALKPDLDVMGNHSDLCFEADKGVFLKAGLGKNRLRDAYIYFRRLFGDADARRASFKAAADQVMQSIDNQHPKVMIGDLTLGEYVVKSVMRECDGEYRLNGGFLKQVWLTLDDLRTEHGVKDAALDPEALSKVGDVRAAQRPSSLRAGFQMMVFAIARDLRRDDQGRPGDNGDSASIIGSHKDWSDYGQNTRLSATSTWSETDVPEDPYDRDVERVARAIDGRKGLCWSNLNSIRAALEKISCTDHLEVDALYRVLALRQSIDVSRRQIIELNRMTPDIRGGLPPGAFTDLHILMEDRRDIIEELRGLSFPDGLCDADALNRAYNRLLDCASNFLDLADWVEQAGAGYDRAADQTLTQNVDRAVETLRRQAIETLCLAAPMRSADPGGEVSEMAPLRQRLQEKDAATLNRLICKNSMYDLRDNMLAPSADRPRTLFKSGRRGGAQPFGELADNAHKALRIATDELNHFLTGPVNAQTQESTARALDAAATFNDRMIADVEHRLLIHGRDDSSALSTELNGLLRKREALNLLKLNLFLARDLTGPAGLDDIAVDNDPLDVSRETPWRYANEYDVRAGDMQGRYSGRSSFDEYNADGRESRLSVWRDQVAPRARNRIGDAPHFSNSLNDESAVASSSEDDIDFRDGFRDDDGFDVGNAFTPNRRRERVDTNTRESMHSDSEPVSEFD